jgi:PAS domain S-box-containing protein
VSTAAPRTLVLCGRDAATAWAEAVPAARVATQLDDDVAAAEFDVAIIDTAGVDAPRAAQRIRARDVALLIVFAARAAQQQALQRVLLFAPGLGESWLVEPGEIDDSLLARAADVTRTRRAYHATRTQLETAFTGGGRAAAQGIRISDAYLAALLQVLPDPVLSIDENDCVLSWSPAAETLLGTAAAAHGRSLAEFVRPQDEAALADLLRRGAAAPTRGELRWLRRDGALRHADVSIAPADVAGHRIRAIVFRDVTADREAQQQLEEQAVELEAQTTELAQQAEVLVDQRDELSRLVQARSRFYASMSHEIRTPINAIIGYNDLLLGGVYGELEPPQLHSVERAQSAARHLRDLVNDVLDLSRIESGKFEIVTEECALNEIVRDVLATILPTARERAVELVSELGDDVLLVTDPRRVRQILLNLLSNAVKFGTGRPVTVRTRSAGGLARVEVQDRGPGLTADQLDRIFEEFVQVHTTDDGDGTGLGLAISRRLAIAIGGSIAAASTPGIGSTFTLALPESGINGGNFGDERRG